MVGSGLVGEKSESMRNIEKELKVQRKLDRKRRNEGTLKTQTRVKASRSGRPVTDDTFKSGNGPSNYPT